MLIVSTLDQYTAFRATAVTDDCGELQDNRFAVVASELFEVVSYRGCADGSSYDVVTVQRCDDTYNPSHGDELMRNYVNSPVLQAYVFKDDTTHSANALFVSLISAALSTF